VNEKVIQLSSARGGTSEADYALLREALEQAVSRVCPPRLADRKDDIVQAGMLRVMRAAERGERRFNKTYLKKTAYSAMIDEIRKLRDDRETSIDVDDRPEPADVEAPSPERHSQAQQIGVAIQECLGHIKADRQRAVTLHLQGHSAPEIGRLLTWGTKRAENFIYRGMAQLRDCLSRKGFQP